MFRSTPLRLAALVALILAPVALDAQEPTPQEPPPEVQGWLLEVQQIQAELAPVQQQAVQEDPTLQEEQQRVSAAVQDAMLEIDPTIPQQEQRIGELQQAAQAAQEAGDVDRIMELSVEAQEIQRRFADVQAEAMQDPEIAPRVEAFQGRLQARMIEIDPEAEARIQRLQELEQRLMEALRQPPSR